MFFPGEVEGPKWVPRHLSPQKGEGQMVMGQGNIGTSNYRSKSRAFLHTLLCPKENVTCLSVHCSGYNYRLILKEGIGTNLHP